MPVVHQFAYGPLNPIGGYVLATVGSLLGLGAATHARATHDNRRRVRWLVIASVAVGSGIWLMHFTAALGFDVPDTPIRYDPLLTGLSAVMAVVVVGIGMFIVGFGHRSPVRVVAGGCFTGGGVAAMHYTGMAAMNLVGTVGYDTHIVAASVLIAVVAATVALWFTTTVDSWWPRVLAAAIMGVAVTAMHYTAMTATRIHLSTDPVPPAGIDPVLLVLPITVIATCSIIGLVLMALHTVAQEDFDTPLTLTRAPAGRMPDNTIEYVGQRPALDAHPTSFATFVVNHDRRPDRLGLLPGDYRQRQHRR